MLVECGRVTGPGVVAGSGGMIVSGVVVSPRGLPHRPQNEASGKAWMPHVGQKWGCSVTVVLLEMAWCGQGKYGLQPR